MTQKSTVVCAWCENPLAEAPAAEFGDATWYGLCSKCSGGPAKGLFPTLKLSELTEAQYDTLPFGLLEVDHQGYVRSYNAVEEQLSGLQRENVLGRHFFNDIAPCTRVQEFEGVFQDLIARAETARHAFDFVFRFAGGDRFVHIAMCYEAAPRRAFILVQVAEEQGS